MGQSTGSENQAAPQGEPADASNDSRDTRTGRDTAADSTTTADGIAIGGWFGRFRVLRELGSGGMGTVYLAEDSNSRGEVALKLPRIGPDEDPRTLQRFYREARTASTIEHRNLCRIHEIGVVDRRHFIVMQYVRGAKLSEFVGGSRPVPPREAAAVVRVLARAMQAAHDAGIVHRDLKPSNVFIDDEREPVVVDFGLALDLSNTVARLTTEGAVLGTPTYMSPEQARGDLDVMGPRCDVYSLGVILYEMLAGCVPFEGPLVAVLAQLMTQEPKPPTDFVVSLDPALSAVCLKAMAKRPEDRFATMTEFATALERWLQDESPKPTSSDVVPAPAEQPVPRSPSVKPASGSTQARSVKPKAKPRRQASRGPSDASIEARAYFRNLPIDQRRSRPPRTAASGRSRTRSTSELGRTERPRTGTGNSIGSALIWFGGIVGILIGLTLIIGFAVQIAENASAPAPGGAKKTESGSEPIPTPRRTPASEPEDLGFE